MWRHQIRARALFTDAWCPSNQVYYIISKVNLSKKLQREKHLMGLSILFWPAALSFWDKGNFESILAGSGIFFSQFSPWSADWAWKRHKIGHSAGSRGISKEAFNNQPRRWNPSGEACNECVVLTTHGDIIKSNECLQYSDIAVQYFLRLKIFENSYIFCP